MDYLRMLKEIDKLVSTDFCAEMEYKELPDSEPYTQEEAKHMSEIIGNVYLVSHSIHCEACGRKYKIK